MATKINTGISAIVTNKTKASMATSANVTTTKHWQN
jgi:hypothetical protein